MLYVARAAVSTAVCWEDDAESEKCDIVEECILIDDDDDMKFR